MVDIHDFVMQLARPLFTFRMARGRYSTNAPHHAQMQSAQTRMENATREIENIVLAYAEVIKKQRDEAK